MRSRLIPWFTAALAGAAALSLAGCATGAGDTPTGVGTWSVNSGEAPSLTFKDNGRYSGDDGCNKIGGTYEQTESELHLNPGLGTLKACPGTDTWLNGARSATISGDTITVFGESGDEIGTLSYEE